VTGEILRPGPLTLEKNIDLMDALAMAGGPTQFADLKKVVIISKDGAGSQVMQYNLKKYQGSGAPGRYFLRPEDTIVLNRKRGGFLGIDSVTGWLGVLAGAGSVALVAYQLHIFGWGEESNP
jgi:protein involved in polysaccharide export with SLBB domain